MEEKILRKVERKGIFELRLNVSIQSMNKMQKKM